MALVACLAALALIVPLVLIGPSATAATPRPLTFETDDITAEQVLDMASDLLDQTTAGPVASRESISTGWFLRQEHLDDGSRRVAISPQVTHLVWNADGSGVSTTTAGTAFWADGSAEVVPEPDAPAAGTVLSETIFAEGEFDVPVRDVPEPTEDGLLRSLASVGLTPGGGSFETMETIKGLFSFWTLSDVHHRGLLTLLLGRDDISVLGTATDRAGRPTVGIAAENNSGLRDILLISAETGRIVGLETVRATADGDLPAGAVVSYTLWKE
jgi:hypothetical protein